MDLDRIKPDRMFDGGDLDCGSGLALLLREHMFAATGRWRFGNAQPRTYRGR